MSVFLSAEQAKAIGEAMVAGDELGNPFRSVELETMGQGFVSATFTRSEWQHGDAARLKVYRIDGADVAL